MMDVWSVAHLVSTLVAEKVEKKAVWMAVEKVVGLAAKMVDNWVDR